VTVTTADRIIDSLGNASEHFLPFQLR